MTEEEWLTGFAPRPLLAFASGKVSERKLWLLGCACVRRVWHALDNHDLLDALALVEAYADGGCAEHALRQASLTGPHWQQFTRARPRLVALAVSQLVSLRTYPAYNLEQALTN